VEGLVEAARNGRPDEELRELLLRLVPGFCVPQRAEETAVSAVP